MILSTSRGLILKKTVLFLIAGVFVFILVAQGFFRGGFGRGGAVPTIAIDKTDGYKLLVDRKPYLIKGACYHPIPVGKDYEYNFWGDPNKPWLVDGEQIKDIGVNTVRFYRTGKNPEEVREVISDLYLKYGI